MKILLIIPYEGHFSNFSSRLTHYMDTKAEKGEISVTTITPPYYSCYSKTKKMLNKRQVALVMIYNLFYFIYRFVLAGRHRYDAIILDSHVIAIPFLLLVKIFPFVRAKSKILVISFFLHGISKNRFVQNFLRFVLGSKGVVLTTQSLHELQYYAHLIGSDRVVYLPFSQHEVSVSKDRGKGKDYIFAGGYTNRDYECLFKAARMVDQHFIIICSKLNRIDLAQKPDNVRILYDTSHADFHGYLKNSKIVVIPLKENTGSSGQMVALAAMFFKKPVIYANTDSISQYFEAGVSGVPYRMNDAQDLANKIRFLLAEPLVRDKLGAKAFETYYAKYHISKYCEKLAHLVLSREIPKG